MSRLVLFDIDGTLVSSRSGIGRQAFAQALHRRFGRTVEIPLQAAAGKTDPEIAESLLKHLGLSDKEVSLHREAILADYLEVLRTTYSEANGAFVYPGVRDLLEALAALPEVAIGLLTGNLEAGARIKLGAFGLNPYFPFGAFGSDHKVRAELPAIAVQRAQAYSGRTYTGKEIVVIGDTVHDLTCGRHLGVRTIGVVTHRPFLREMEAAGPDYLFEDLAPTEAVVQAILAEAPP